MANSVPNHNLEACKMHILVTDNLHSAGAELLLEAGFTVDVIDGRLSEEELLACVADYEGIIVRSGTRISQAVLDQATKLKVVGRAGSGVDNIDVAAASRKGVVVMNTPGGNTVTTAEHAIAMTLSMARKIPQASATLRSGRWAKKEFMGTEVTGKTMGVLGMGNIGTVVARRAMGLGMRVLAFDPYLKESEARRIGVEPADLETVLAKSDFVTIHVPGGQDTHHLLNAERLALMKPGAHLINCARGGIVDEAALLDALNSGHLAGAALDVFEVEPPPADHPLLGHPNVVATPHLGASTTDAQINVAVAVAQQFVDYLKNGVIANALNFPPIPREAYQRLRPYLALAEKMASFIAQLSSGTMEELEVEYRGEIPADDLTPITIAAVKGLLTPALRDSVNHINAMTLAAERGVKIRETRAQVPRDYLNLIALKYRVGGVERLIAGTLFGKTEPRIVHLDNYRVEIVPEGHLLICTNRDEPGVLGAIGSGLGTLKINIGGLQLGRDRRGGNALSVFSIDQAADSHVITELQKIKHVTSAVSVSL